jgi:ATP-dependent exoDNAse (exonuclease V) beta subunit
MTDPGIGDAEARERAIRYAGSVLVQAPAGSGKTTLLAQRYLHLLAQVDAPERILALTFTRRAAEEMRERVVAGLAAARLPAPPSGMNPETWRLGLAAVRHMDALGIDLEVHPARLRIETIDAFNAWLAAQLPITAATGSPLRTSEDPGDAYEEAAGRALAREGDDEFAAAVARVLALADQRWSLLVERLVEMLGSREHWLPSLVGSLEAGSREAGSLADPVQVDRVRREFDADLEFLVARTLKAAAAAVGGERLAVLSSLVAVAAARLGEARPALAAWRRDASPLRGSLEDLPRWRALSSLLLTAEETLRSRWTKTEGFPPGCADKAVMQDLAGELARDPEIAVLLADVGCLPEPAYGDAEWHRVRDVACVLVLAAAELDRVFHDTGNADFPAVAIAAKRALGEELEPTDLTLRLDYRLQHVLIDEFQDTSAPQLKLLRVLTAGWQPGDGRSIFCVGDPMQSIYRFRHAEVRAFLEIAEDGVGDLRFEVQRLTSNFRTAAPLVAWSNATFARILPPRDDRDRGAIAFRPSSAVGAPPPGIEVGVRLEGYADRDTEAQAVAALVAARHAEHPDWHIAILVRARAHAEAIAAALRDRGIAFGAVDIEPLEDRPVVRDLLNLARALLHLGDRTAWLGLLRSPWVGLELADLSRLARGGAILWDALGDAAVLSQLSPAGAVRCTQLHATLTAAMALRTQESFARWLERTWLALGGPACAGGVNELEQARMVFAKLHSLEPAGLPDPAVFGAAFDGLYARDAARRAVEIMTIHKAKGLEFDLVIVPGLDRAVANRSDEILLSQPIASGAREGLVLAARPAIGDEDSPLFEFLRRQGRQAAALEAERLLYVACTRAKWQLCLTATLGAQRSPEDAADEAGSGEREWRPPAGSLLAALWPVASGEFTGSLAAGRDRDRDRGRDRVAPAPRALRGGPLRRVPLHWRPAVLPPPFALADAPVGIEARDAWPVFDWAGETARHVGSLVHAELQTLRLDGAGAGVGGADPGARLAVYGRWLALRGVPRERLAEAAARVAAALTAVREDPRARWILDERHRASVREYAVSGPWHGEIVNVVFDRSFIDAAGVRWVIDYKTSEHQGGGLEEFLDREQQRYGAQMARYAALARRLGPEPVRVALYFPLMRAWREWDALD